MAVLHLNWTGSFDQNMNRMKLFNKKYYLKFDKYWHQVVNAQSINDRFEFFKSYCLNKKVLHFGCTDWPIFDANNNLHIKLSKFTSVLHGFDIDTEGIENLKNFVNEAYFNDFEQLSKIEYDVCLIPETIEHVDNVQIFLNNISKIKAGVFIITAPNCFSKENIRRNFYGNQKFIEVVHPGNQFVKRVRHDEMIAFFLHLAHESMIAEQGFLEERQQATVANIGIVFRAGNCEFLCGDTPVEHLPAPWLFHLPESATHFIRIEASDQRCGTDAATGVVEPQC